MVSWVFHLNTITHSLIWKIGRILTAKNSYSWEGFSHFHSFIIYKVLSMREHNLEIRVNVEGRDHVFSLTAISLAQFLVVRVQLIYFVHVFWINEGTKLNLGKLNMIKLFVVLIQKKKIPTRYFLPKHSITKDLKFLGKTKWICIHFFVQEFVKTHDFKN